MDLQTAKDYVEDLLEERAGLYAEIRGLQAVIESLRASNRRALEHLCEDDETGEDVEVP